MILLSNGERPQSGLFQFLENEFCALLEETDEYSPILPEIAKAVGNFVLEREATRPVDERTLMALASRAMLAVGEQKLASRVLLFGTGLVRHAIWDVAAEEELWVLDMRQLVPRNSELLEISLLGSVNIILEAMADVWDQTGGRGTLGLRHISFPCCGEARRRHKRSRKSLATEIADHCRRKLEQLSRSRSWPTTPRVMNLDF